MPLYPAYKPPFLSVASAGTASDGATDDATKINNFIAASPVGSTIFFPGNHAIGATIQLVANRTYLSTAGRAGSPPTFVQKNGANLSAMLASYEWYNNQAFSANPIRVENISCDGNAANNISVATHGIVVQGYDSLIKWCEVKNVKGSGIVLTSKTANGTSSANGAAEMHVESCKVDTAGGYGIYGQDGGGFNLTDCYVQDCEIATTTLDGINVDTLGGWRIHKNHLYGGQANGIIGHGGFATSIVGNYIDGFAYGASAFYYGIAVTLNGPRPTIIAENIVTADQEFNDSTNYNYIGVFSTSTTNNTVAMVYGNHIQGGYVNTTSTSTLVAGAKTVCTPASMERIYVGQVLGFDTGGSFETNTVASVTTTTFTPANNWAHNHGPASFGVYSNHATSQSLALTYEGNTTQISNGYSFNMISYGNRADLIGQYIQTDSFTSFAPTNLDGPLVTYLAFPWVIPGSSTIAPSAGGVIPLNPAANVTGIILAPGSQPGQHMVIVNESAFTITFAAASSNVSGGSSVVIAAGGQRLFVWNSYTNLWYGDGQPPIQSATAVATASSGTIATAGLGVSRVNPAAAVTGIILAAGTYAGQSVKIVNESAFTLTMAASGTSNVADGVANIILPNETRLYAWDSGTSLWSSKSTAPVQSATAVATASSGTIATAGLDVSRVNPAAAITGVILAAGTYAGQSCRVVNESAFTITMAVSGTSNSALGVSDVIQPLSKRVYTWDSGTSLWYGNTNVPVQSATAVVIAASGVIATAGLGVSRLNPSAARTGITMQAGTYATQQCWVVNESAFVLTYNATPATSLIANSAVVTTLAATTSRLFVWDSSTSLWY